MCFVKRLIAVYCTSINSTRSVTLMLPYSGGTQTAKSTRYWRRIDTLLLLLLVCCLLLSNCLCLRLCCKSITGPTRLRGHSQRDVTTDTSSMTSSSSFNWHSSMTAMTLCSVYRQHQSAVNHYTIVLIMTHSPLQSYYLLPHGQMTRQTFRPVGGLVWSGNVVSSPSPERTVGYYSQKVKGFFCIQCITSTRWRQHLNIFTSCSIIIMYSVVVV